MNLETADVRAASIGLSAADRERVQKALDHLGLSASSDFRWDKGNVLYLYETDDAIDIADSLTAVGSPAEAVFAPDPATFGGSVLGFIKFSMPAPVKARPQ